MKFQNRWATAAVASGGVCFDQGCLLLRCIAEASAPVELHKVVVRSIFIRRDLINATLCNGERP